MDKRARLQAAIGGQRPDRVPVALWRHFPVDDQRPEDLAAATLEWQARHDFDFVKVTPSSSYCLRDWGVEDAWRGNPEGTRDYVTRAIQRPEDWAKLRVLDPHDGHLGAMLKALDLIGRGLGGATPFIQTIFSPLSQACNLVGSDLFPIHAREHGQALTAGLRTVTANSLRFIEAARATGLDGIFYAVQHASTSVFSRAEYRALGEPYDRQILESVQDLWLNVVHVHGQHIMFDLAATYPAAVINWHDTETAPDLASGQQLFGGAVCGGLRQWQTMVCGSPDSVRAEARRALALTGSRRFILGTGCVTPIVAPRANILAARAIAEE